MRQEFSKTDIQVFNEWRELGFYYDLDERGEIPQWRFFASKTGFQKFSLLLRKYAENPINTNLSEHEHYGPYFYLKIVTSDKNQISADMFEVTIQGVKHLAELISSKALEYAPGQIFSIDEEFGIDNTASTLFFLMDGEFDPATIDKSLRQKM